MKTGYDHSLQFCTFFKEFFNFTEKEKERKKSKKGFYFFVLFIFFMFLKINLKKKNLFLQFKTLLLSKSFFNTWKKFARSSALTKSSLKSLSSCLQSKSLKTISYTKRLPNTSKLESPDLSFISSSGVTNTSLKCLKSQIDSTTLFWQLMFFTMYSTTTIQK